MLFAVDHRLGDSRKSACGVGAPRLFCFNAGFSGSPNGILTQPVAHRSIRVHKSALKNPLEGYRRLTFMMLDADIVAVSPASVWRVLSRAGLLRKWNGKASKKGTGFEQPPQPHQHWHIDVSYLNVCATFYYLCSILDGYSRFLVHWDLRESMSETDIEIILERAKERFPGVKPRVISDNGPQFIAKDFKEFIRLS